MVELKEQLEVEEEDGDRQEEKEDVVMSLTLRPMISHEVAKSNQVLKIKNLQMAVL